MTNDKSPMFFLPLRYKLMNMENQGSEKELFLAKSEINAHDLTQKRKISFNIDHYTAALEKGKNQFSAIELARKQAKNIKWKAIEHLDTYLETFEKKFLEKGGQVLWAETAEEALDFILEICKEKDAKTIIKAKSSITEEIQLNSFLKRKKIETIETDLGVFIQQLNDEDSFHPIMPAIQSSKEDIGHVFHEKFGLAAPISPAIISSFLSAEMKMKFSTAEIGITGANFLIAEEGAVCISENEGNARLATAFPKTHIVIAGIENIIPSLKDLELFWPMFSTFSTGQKMDVYNSIFSGPRQQGEVDGPENMIVILLDNGRSNLLRAEVRESLYCIQCGACSNVCPVYKNIGGLSYGSPVVGPIGAVVTPHLKDMHTFGHLSYASTLCGSCSEICPVHIDVHGMLAKNRKIFVEDANESFKEKMAWRIFSRGMLHRQIMNNISIQMKNKLFKKLFHSSWGERRSDIVFSEKSFNQQWKEKGKKN